MGIWNETPVKLWQLYLPKQIKVTHGKNIFIPRNPSMKADAEATEVCLHTNTQSDSSQVETACSSVRASVEGVWTDSGPRESLSLHPGALTEPIHTDAYIHSTDTHAMKNTHLHTYFHSFILHHTHTHTHSGQSSSGQACQPTLVSCTVQMAFVFVSWRSSWCLQQLKFSSNMT